jgi:hypothetical protein
MTRYRNPAGASGGADRDLRFAIDCQATRNEYSRNGVRLKSQRKIPVSDELKAIIRRWRVDESGVVVSLQNWRVANGR